MKGKRAFKLVNGKAAEIKRERDIDMAMTRDGRRPHKKSREPISDIALAALLLSTVGTILLSVFFLGVYGGR